MATSESTTIDGRSRPCISEDSAPNASMADGDAMRTLRELPLTGVEGIPLACGRSSTRTFRPRRMTVGYIGPHVPYLRMQGRWLDSAGFGVGTPVRVEVSERRLVMEAIQPEGRFPRAAAISGEEIRDEGSPEADLVRVPVTKSHPVERHHLPTWHSRMGTAFADALKEVLPIERRRERVSERALADRAELTSNLIRLFEKGSRLPSIPIFIVLAWALDLDPRTLFDRVLGRVCPDGSRPVLAGRTAPDLPRESGNSTVQSQ